MIDLIEKNRPAINALCSQYGVKRLELFGSAAVGTFDPKTSDLDFLVEFQSLRPGQAADAYFGLLFSLKDLLGCSVDLLMPTAIKNPYLLQSINQQRQLLYAA